MRKPEAPGLYKRGEVWWIRYSLGGRQIRRSTGVTSRKAAEALLGKTKAELFAGTHFPEARMAGLTVGELRDRWLARSKHKRTVQDDEIRFRRIAAFFGPDRPITDITTPDVEEFREALLSEPLSRKKDVARGPKRGEKKKDAAEPERTLSPATVNRHLEILRSSLRFADREEYLTRKPEVRLLEVRNARADRVCSDDEYTGLLGAATGELRLAIIVARHSGMRLGEIVGLTWDRVDLKRGLVKLRDRDTKTGEGRTVPLGQAAIEALREWPRRLGETRVFAVKDGRSISPLFSRLTRALAIVDLHFHDLRGTRLTELRRAGADLKQIQAISGHRTLAILVERYQAISEEELIEVARKAERKGEPS